MFITRYKFIGIRLVFAIILMIEAFGVLPVRAASSIAFGWAKKMGGSSYDRGESLAVDAHGNVYSTGNFSATVDFDPGAGTYNLTSAGQADAFVSKLDAHGNFVWAKRIGGTSDNFGVSIVPDGDGNLYFAGSFTGTVDFDPNAGTHNLTSAGSYDASVSKMDANGNFLWAFRLGGIADDKIQGLVTDGMGAIYVTGGFSDTVDFDPGAGMSNLTSAGADDIFIAKFDGDGSLIWAKSMPGTGGLITGGNSGNELALDVSGNIYTIGTFTDTVDFDPGAGVYNLTTGSSINIFISKLNSGGDFVWAKSMGGSSGDIGSDIGIDDQGYVLSTGSFNGTADFDPGPDTYNLISAGYWDNYIVKLDADGNLVWAKAIGGTLSDNSYGLALDTGGNVYTTGGFASTVDFDPGAGTYNLSATSVDLFISKLDTNGNFVWVQHMPGTGVQYGMGIVVDANGNIYTVGDNLGVTDFDPGPSTYNLSTSGYNDIFISKLTYQNTTPFTSVGAPDGWVLESSENSNQGAAINAAAATFLLGDHASNRQYRSILHFNTSSLPDNALITRVTLKIRKQSVIGADPFTTHLKIAVDIRKGAFSNSGVLQATDFQTPASKAAVGMFANNPGATGWYATRLKPAAYPFINRTGITQFRLGFQTDDDNDLVADFIRFYSGDAAAGNRPILVIEYYVP